jgi:NTE family protein
LRLYADALERYRNGDVHYVKLLDGGLVDNFGLAGINIARLAADTPYGPLEPEEAVKLRRLLFLVVDAGQAPSGDWVKTVQGPAGVDLVAAISNTATESGAVGSYSAFQNTMADWQESLAQWRCKLSAADRHRFGAPPDWNCKDVRFFIGRISFDQFEPQRRAALNAVETRFRLPPPQVDLLIDAGREALKGNGAFRSFLKSLEPVAPRRGRPVAQNVQPLRPQPEPQNAATLSAAIQ